MATNDKEQLYFAAKDAEHTARIVLGKADSFYNNLRANTYLEKLSKMWRAYHGAYGDNLGTGHEISFSGEQGELVQFPVNHFRNLAQHIYVMITANRPTMEARAINTDYKSLAQTYLANGILDYYMREKKLEDAVKKAVETSIVLGSGFIKLEWNATAGEIYDVDDDTGEFNYEGELEFSNLSPLDVVVDGTKETWNHEWILVRSFQNRYNLMAKYPELADRIKSLPSKVDKNNYRLTIFSNDDTDDIPVYEFYHKRSEALPEGRYLLFLADDIVLLDTKLPYRTIPIFRIAPSDFLGTPYGYSPMFDIFPIQELINTTYSTIATNQNAFGVQNLYVPRGADINVNSLEGGMNIIEGNAEPKPINLTQTPAEVFKFLEILIQSAETISGVNSVARGAPEASLKSGTALALVQSMALQFISGLQQSYVKLIEDIGTSLINILKDFAKTPKVVALVGKNNRTFLKEFTGEQINAINRVVVDVGNPLAKTTAGRVQMAQELLQMGLITQPTQYFEVLNTGKLDVTFEGEMSELLLIKHENEKLSEGQHILVNPLEKHRIHIMEHKSVLNDPDLKNDASLVKNVMDHIEAHVNALRNTDPDLLAMIGEQPLPPIPTLESPIPPSQQGVNNVPSQNSPTPDMLASQQGQVQAGQTIQGPGVENINMPGLPTPPPPFEQLPVTPDQMIQG